VFFGWPLPLSFSEQQERSRANAGAAEGGAQAGSDVQACSRGSGAQAVADRTYKSTSQLTDGGGESAASNGSQ
jgi:hypothetical protein